MKPAAGETRRLFITGGGNRRSNWLAATDDTRQNYDNGHNEQDVNKSVDRIG